MIVRRLALPMAVCALALLSFSAQAQNVFVPSDGGSSDGSASSGVTSSNPSYSAPDSGSLIFAPPSETTNAAPAPQVEIPPQAVAPTARPVPPSQRDEFAYRTLGLEVPKESARAMQDPLAGFTPEQIETARKGFAAMEADNPAMAARNPFRQLDAMAAAQKAQEAIKARANAACDSQTVNVMVSPQSFMRTPGASEGLAKTGVATIGNLIQGICSDKDMRSKFTTSVPMITIVNRSGSAPDVVVTDGIITLSMDFTSTEPPPMGPLRAAFTKAVDDTDKLMNARTEEPATK